MTDRARRASLRPYLLFLSSLIAVCLMLAIGRAQGPAPVRAAVPDDQAPKGAAPAVRRPTRVTDELLVFLNPGASPSLVAREHGLAVRYRLRSDADAYVMRAPVPIQVGGPAPLAAQAARDRRVRAVYLNEHTLNVPMSFVPDDPYFHKNTPTTGRPGQWHLINEIVAGRDAGVQGAWDRDVTGLGVTIGIVDDCLQTTHPDLAPNYVAADSFDFGQGDANPDPVYSNDQHGISVAGVAAARGGNGIGVTGAAPYAGLAGMRVDFPNQTTAMFVDATLYHSSSATASGGPRVPIKNHSYGVPDTYVEQQAEADAVAVSAGYGAIHCYAAGNERGSKAQDTGKTQPQNSPNVISVAALGSDGKVANYSSFGACVFVTAPSSSSTGYGITTTDRVGEAAGYNGSGDSFPDPDYTALFGGTSSATPLVSGVLALARQVQPRLDVRFAKHLLVKSCDIVDAADASSTSDGGWKTNAAGNAFNQNYGFGKINADRLTQQAALYRGVTPLTVESTDLVPVYAPIPDNSPGGLTRTFALASTTPLEEILIALNVTHPYRGDLEAYLTSPAGTTSRLMIRSSSDSGADIYWTFCTNAFWGENPAGTWTLNVRDTAATDTGTWNSFRVTARMGALLPRLATTLTAGKVTGTLYQKVSLTATLKTASPLAALSGRTVDFTVDGVSAGSAVTNTSGVATRAYTIPGTTTLGAHAIGASFGGDPDYGGSTATSTLTVNKASTSVTVTSLIGVVGRSVALTARLKRTADGVYLPDMQIDFQVAGIPVGSATTNATGTATLPYTVPDSLGTGAKTVRASFAGDASYNASAGSGTLTVKIAPVISVAGASGAPGETVTLSANLTRDTDNAPLGGKTLVFKVSTTSAGSTTTDPAGDGSVKFKIPASLGAGAKTVTVTFAGDSTYVSASGTGTLTVVPAGTTLAAADATGAPGATIPLTATLLRTTDSGPVSGKSVKFTVGTTVLGSATTSTSGVATLKYKVNAALGAGAKALTVAFAGDSLYTGSSASATLTVTAAGTTLTVASPTGSRGAAVTLSATLKRATDGAAVSGKALTFLIDGVTVRTVTTSSTGTASFAYTIPTTLVSGAHAITVEFAGDALYQAATGAGTLTVN